MAYGLSDIVQQRRMIDESSAREAFKRVSISKLDALVGLAETANCRRTRLLGYFGESLNAAKCSNCDNCLSPPLLRDGKVIAQKLLSCAYRTGQRFGAMHLIDVLVGRLTERVKQFGHDRISVFGIGAELNEKQWRAALRQLVALGHLQPDSEAFGALKLTESARGVLKGETSDAARGTAGSRIRASRAKSRAAILRPGPPDGRRPAIQLCSAFSGRWRSESRASAACRPMSYSTMQPWTASRRRVRQRLHSSVASPASATRSSNITATNCFALVNARRAEA